MKITFCNHPQPIKMVEYVKAISFFVKKVSQVKEVVSIYQVGEVSVPGISDVDFVIVVKRQGLDFNQLRTTVAECFQKYREIYVEHPMIMDEELMKKLNWIVPHFKIKKLWGKSVPIKKQDQENNLLFLIDMINWLWPKEFVELTSFGHINWKSSLLNNILNQLADIVLPKQLTDKLPVYIEIRKTLCRLSSMKYALLLYESLGEKMPEKWKAYVDRVVALKQN